jgi:hypothetical protein
VSALRLLAVAGLVIGMGQAVKAEDKKAEVNKDQLVGTWETTRSNDTGFPVGSTLQLVKDGTAQTIRKTDGKDLTLPGM